MSNKGRLITTLLIAVALGAAGAIAAPAPETPAGQMLVMEGKVDSIDIKRGELVVSDMRYAISTTTPIRTAGGRTRSADRLRVGSRVRLYIPRGTGPLRQPIGVSEIEVLRR